MNFVSFSPHFPVNYAPFCTQLRQRGITVLGLADAPYHELQPELRAALSEYYKVSEMNNYSELVRALGYFTHRYGKLDRLESHNEYWLETDARLRQDFNIPGFHPADMSKIKRKSKMKSIYVQAGIPVARGRIAHNLREGLALADETGFPLVAKPDIGVGANRTYRLDGLADMEAFFEEKPPVDYILEEFVRGAIQTFDGLVDQGGQIVFSSSMQYSEGVMEQVNNGLDFCYWTLRDIPADLEEAGARLVKAYRLRERFFHFEFFRTPEGGLVGLEVNMRPPGGLTTDMWNFANDIDIYSEYANVVAENCFEAEVTHPYFCAYAGRRKEKRYRHEPNEIRKNFPQQVMLFAPISGIFSSAIGDFGFVVRSPDFEEVEEVSSYILETA